MSSSESQHAWQNQTVITAFMRPYYQPAGLSISELPFHNYDHALKVGHRAARLARVAIENGVDIDTSILPLAASGHDAGSWLKAGIDHPFAIPEDYAADITGFVGQLLRAPENKLAACKDVVRASGSGTPCTTDTERCFRQADLSAEGLLDNPISFLNGTYRLYQESKIIAGEPPAKLTSPSELIKDLIKFGVQSHEVLTTFLEEDISLGDFDRDNNGKSLFAIRAARNIELLTPARLTEFLTHNLLGVVNYNPVKI